MIAKGGRSSLDKGKNGERFVAAAYHDELGWDVRRTLAGHKDDLGDLIGVPRTTVQVKVYSDIVTGIRLGLQDLALQHARTANDFAVLWAKGGRGVWICVQTPTQHMNLLREALA